MKSRMRAVSCLLLIFCFICSAVYAAIDISDIGVGARPLGLGKAYVGLADDASAIFVNPAGLSQNDRLNLISMSGAMLSDVNYVMVGGSEISPFGKIGIGYINASVGGIPLTTITGSGSMAVVTQYGVSDFNSSLFIFSYGSRLSRFLKGRADNVGMGASLKIFSQGFSGGAVPPSGGSNPLNDAIGSGMDADLGLIWDVRSWATVGLTLQNFLPESFGGKFVWQKNQVVEGIPMVVKAGTHLGILGNTALRQAGDQKLDMMIDYENNSSQGRPATWHLGAEWFPLNTFAIRLGLDQKPKADETGTGVDNNLSAGIGICLAGFTFDYAYHQFGELKENATHFFSIGFRGGGPAREQAERKGEKGKPTLPVPEVIPKPKLKTFIDVPEGYWAKKPIEYLATLGIMDGYADGTFKPTKEITRGELAVLLVNAKGFQVEKDIKVRFSDVSLQSYEAPYISMAVEKKYITGYPDGTFRPGKRVTRAEAAVILARFSGLYTKPKVREKVFPDLSINHWASPAVAATKETGLFEYLGGSGFGPNMFLPAPKPRRSFQKHLSRKSRSRR